MEKISEICNFYIASLRAVALQAQNNHWRSAGENFYGNHLLFERIYKSAAEDADQAAERMIGLFGPEALNLNLQAQMISKSLEKVAQDEPLSSSLAIEEKFLEISQSIYDTLEKEGKMTLGLSDMITGISSSRENAIYLLKQANKQGEKTMNSKMAARKKLLTRLAQATPVVDKAQEEKSAFAALKRELSIAITTMTKGHPASFKMQAQYVPGGPAGATYYNFTIGLATGGPEAAVADQLRKDLPAIINKVPFFSGKVQGTNVVVA